MGDRGEVTRPAFCYLGSCCFPDRTTAPLNFDTENRLVRLAGSRHPVTTGDTVRRQAGDTVTALRRLEVTVWSRSFASAVAHARVRRDRFSRLMCSRAAWSCSTCSRSVRLTIEAFGLEVVDQRACSDVLAIDRRVRPRAHLCSCVPAASCCRMSLNFVNAATIQSTCRVA